jgi:hypothetical protein
MKPTCYLLRPRLVSPIVNQQIQCFIARRRFPRDEISSLESL